MSRIATKTQIATLRNVRLGLREGKAYSEIRKDLPKRTLRSLFSRKWLYHCPTTGEVTLTQSGRGLLAQVSRWEVMGA